MKLILKLFAEITIKSPSVRRKMVRTLTGNIQRALTHEGLTARAIRRWDHIEVDGPDDERHACIPLLTRTPGVGQVLDVEAFPLSTFEDIAQVVVPAWATRLPGRRFRVSVKRAGRHAFTSIELERWLGAQLLAAAPDAKVSLDHPEINVRVDVTDDRVLMVREQHAGLGGYPLGEAGEALSLLSGGFDSGVASYLTLRRGIVPHFVFFNLGGVAHELGVKQLAHYLWERYGSGRPLLFYSVPFDTVVSALLQHVEHGLMGVVLKRLMLRAADRIAERHGIPALVTGESVSQVSSQTLHNLAVIEQSPHRLVLRPLSLTDKAEIIRIARDIGTAEFAASMPEYCGVISDRPNIAAPLREVLDAEAALPEGLLDEALARARWLPVSRLLDDILAAPPLPPVGHPQEGDRVIDIRLDAARARAPLSVPELPVQDILHIPFPGLAGRFSSLRDDGHRYLLYCDRGVLSQLHGQYLRDQGISNVGVYRPDA